MADRLKINKKFASQYVKKKEHEERSLLKERYGEDALSESSSSSEEEDDDAEGWTSEVEKDFLRTLSLLKSKDPRVYDNQTEFYSHAAEEKSGDPGPKGKPVHLKDYERQRLLEKGSKAGLSDSESEDADVGVADGGVAVGGITYRQQQDEIKASFLSAAAQEEEGGAGEGALLVPRVKTKEDKDREECEFVEWLKGGGVELAQEMASDLVPLKEYWTDPLLSGEERFLRDYILNKGYLDTSTDKVPSYNEIVGSESESDSEAPPSDSEAPPSDSEDEQALQEQETFERKFNFRFEEPDGDLITSYPRTLGGSVRREDDRRKIKRQKQVAKKAQEKEAMKNDIRRLRNLQEIELKDKLEKLARVTGNPVESFGLTAEDIQADFDPEAYDRAMEKVFDASYYAEGEEEKPQFSDLGEGEDEMEGDASYSWLPESDTQEDFNMDADYVFGGGSGDVELDHGNTRRKKRKKSHLNLDPSAQALEKQQLESRLKGQRFRYREVEPNDFGLSTEEILCCDNKELNCWVSLSKAVQYFTAEEETKWKKTYHKKGRNWKRKKAILTSYYSNAEEETESDPVKGVSSHVTQKVKGVSSRATQKKGKLKKKLQGKKQLQGKDLSKARLKAYGL